MDNLELSGQKLGRVFNPKSGHLIKPQTILLLSKTAKLRVEKPSDFTLLVDETFSPSLLSSI
jgi:hypothetical protein